MSNKEELLAALDYMLDWGFLKGYAQEKYRDEYEEAAEKLRAHIDQLLPEDRDTWQDIETFETNGEEVIAWISSDKGFQDVTARLLYIYNDQVSESLKDKPYYQTGWYWGEGGERVKRPDLIRGAQPWPKPPKDKP